MLVKYLAMENYRGSDNFETLPSLQEVEFEMFVEVAVL